MEYYSKIKGNGLSSHERTQMKLKCILLSKTSQSEKAKYMILIIQHFDKGNIKEAIKKETGCQRLKEREEKNE